MVPLERRVASFSVLMSRVGFSADAHYAPGESGTVWWCMVVVVVVVAEGGVVWWEGD